MKIYRYFVLTLLVVNAEIQELNSVEVQALPSYNSINICTKIHRFSESPDGHLTLLSNTNALIDLWKHLR